MDPAESRVCDPRFVIVQSIERPTVGGNALKGPTELAMGRPIELFGRPVVRQNPIHRPQNGQGTPSIPRRAMPITNMIALNRRGKRTRGRADAPMDVTARLRRRQVGPSLVRRRVVRSDDAIRLPGNATTRPSVGV